MRSSPYLGIECGGGGGPPQGLVHNLLMQFCTVGCSKSEIYLFDIVITENDHPTHVKYVLGSIYVFFPRGADCGPRTPTTPPFASLS